MNCYILNSGSAEKQIDVGAKWEAGVIWGFNGNSGSSKIGNNVKSETNLAEITIGSNKTDQQ